MKNIFIYADEKSAINYDNAIKSTKIQCNLTYSREITKCANHTHLILCGGGDVNPAFYNMQNQSCKNVSVIRDLAELYLISYFYSHNLPILGICRGMQVINVFLGGSLHQHIDNHCQDEDRGILTHGVTVNEGGLLHKIEGREHIEVNSFHHQVVNVLAPCLDIDGSSDGDGYIEAFHHKDHPFLLGVQWHPEDYFGKCETSGKIFKAFISACKK